MSTCRDTGMAETSPEQQASKLHSFLGFADPKALPASKVPICVASILVSLRACLLTQIIW